VETELAEALDDLILGRGVARGRHSLRHRERLVRDEFIERLMANGFRPMTVREERIPGFYLSGDTADFGYFRWEIFTPKSRRKLFASERRRKDNNEWEIQLNLSSRETVWACPERKETHDVETVVAVNP